MALTPNEINTLVKAVEHDVRGVIKEYFDVRIAEELDAIKTQMVELYETQIEQAERLGSLEVPDVGDD